MTTNRFLIVIDQAGNNFSGHAPDLPGCVATGETREEVVAAMREAVPFHIEGLKEDGVPIPPPRSSGAYVSVTT